MVLAHKDMNKLKSFIKFWMEKIELEVTDQDEFEYPKYLLRTTLCNLMSQLDLYSDCLKQANFNIKEISSDLKVNKLNSQDQSIKEKARLLVLSLLYKSDCLISLRDGSSSICHEILNKCEGILEKYGLKDDEQLRESLTKKLQKLKLLTIQELEINKTPKHVQSQNAAIFTGRGQKKFILKSKTGDSSSRVLKQKRSVAVKDSKTYDRDSRENSPKFTELHFISK